MRVRVWRWGWGPYEEEVEVPYANPHQVDGGRVAEEYREAEQYPRQEGGAEREEAEEGHAHLTRAGIRVRVGWNQDEDEDEDEGEDEDEDAGTEQGLKRRVAEWRGGGGWERRRRLGVEGRPEGVRQAASAHVVVSTCPHVHHHEGEAGA